MTKPKLVTYSIKTFRLKHGQSSVRDENKESKVFYRLSTMFYRKIKKMEILVNMSKVTYIYEMDAMCKQISFLLKKKSSYKINQ